MFVFRNEFSTIFENNTNYSLSRGLEVALFLSLFLFIHWVRYELCIARSIIFEYLILLVQIFR